MQDPEEAWHASMPRSAMENVGVDAVMTVRDLASALTHWAHGGGVPTNGGGHEAGARSPQGHPLITVCPECGGVMQEHDAGGVPYWTCHVGHQYSPRTLADRQGVEVEAALWTAVRTLEDRQALLRRLAAQAETRDQPVSARHFRRQADVSSEQAGRIRAAITSLADTAGLGDTLAEIEELEQ